MDDVRSLIDACWKAKTITELIPALPKGMKPRYVHVIDAVWHINEPNGQDTGTARVGMAANMIGVGKRIIAFVDEDLGGRVTVMLNPVITASDGAFDTQEGCLSLAGERRTLRYRRIEVNYEDRRFRARHATFTGWTAQIIQHEVDHCNGIII